MYNSIRYFGRPNSTDIQNAQYILSLPRISREPKYEPVVELENVIDEFNTALSDYQINCKIEVSNKVISKVQVLSSKNTIMFNPDAQFTQNEVSALIEHEIGVHMVTTHNSKNQKLKIFNLGLPVNTKTQEGIAILSEYLSGNISLKRLKKIALRVVVTDLMCNGANFIESLNVLVNKYRLAYKDAYTLTTRVYRGGGFTKDYLYLSGFAEMYKLWNKDYNFNSLLVGKTSIEFNNTIIEMIERDIIEKPTLITKSLINPNPKIEKDNIYKYILSGLK